MDDDMPLMSVATRPEFKAIKDDHSQCYRLYSCIQAAVAKLVETDETKRQSAAQRAKILLELIPQNPSFPLGNLTCAFANVIPYR